jgi:hypothetical protein
MPGVPDVRQARVSEGRLRSITDDHWSCIASPTVSVPAMPRFMYSWKPATAGARSSVSSVCHRTVEQLADANVPEELFRGQWQNRPTKLDAFKRYLHQRWDEGRTNAWQLWEEITERGYRGGYGTVRDYLTAERMLSSWTRWSRSIAGREVSEPRSSQRRPKKPALRSANGCTSTSRSICVRSISMPVASRRRQPA